MISEIKREELIKGFIQYLLQEDVLKRSIEEYLCQFESEVDAREYAETEGLRICEHCKETYLPKRSDSKYCNKSCKDKANSQRNPRKHIKLKDQDGKRKTIFQRRNESIKEFEKRVQTLTSEYKRKRVLNTV